MHEPDWQPTLRVVWCLIWWLACLEKYGHTWHLMSLLRPGVITQSKPKPTLFTLYLQHLQESKFEIPDSLLSTPVKWHPYKTVHTCIKYDTYSWSKFWYEKCDTDIISVNDELIKFALYCEHHQSRFSAEIQYTIPQWWQKSLVRYN